MPGEFIHPNWHVVLIHYPIALLTLGVAIELLTLLFKRAALRTAGRGMIVAGALLALPAATSGTYALYDTVRTSASGEASHEPAGHSWYQLKRDARLSEQQWSFLESHAWRMAGATTLLAIAFVTYLGASDRWRDRLYALCLIVLLGAVALMMSGAWYAGETVYVDGTAIERGASGVDLPVASKIQAIKRFVPPLQLHTLLAGLTMAAALAALAMAIRALNVDPPREARSHDEAYFDSPAVQTRMIVIIQRVRPSRYWIACALLAIGTLAAGLWVGGVFYQEVEAHKPRIGLAQKLAPLAAQPRNLAHMIVGGSIVLFTLILAALGHWWPWKKWMLSVFATLLMLAVLAQIWVGVLLMFDGSNRSSSLIRFHSPAAQTP